MNLATVAVAGLDGRLRYLHPTMDLPEAEHFLDLLDAGSLEVADQMVSKLDAPGQQASALLQLGTDAAPWISVTATRLPAGLSALNGGAAAAGHVPEETLILVVRPCPADTHPRLIERPFEIIAITDPERRINFVSEHCPHLFGWEPEELAKRYFGLLHPDDVPETFAKSVAVRDKDVTEQSGCSRLRHLDGSWRSAEIHAFNLLTVPAISGVVNSVRVRPDSPASWRPPAAVSSAWARGQDSTYAVIMADPSGVISVATPSIHTLWGFDPRALVGTRVDAVLDHSAIAALPTEPGGWVPCRTRVLLPDGTSRWAEGHTHNLVNEPNVDGVLWVLTDVHDRVEAELALRASEERFRALVQNALDLIEITDEHGVVTWISPSVEPIFGLHPDQVVGRPALDFVHPDDHRACARLLRQVLAEPGSTGQTVCRAGADQTHLRWIECTATNHLRTPAVSGIVWNLRDVTDRMAALRESSRLTDILETTTDYVGISEPGGDLVYLNASARRLLGIPLDLPTAEISKALLNDRVVARQWSLDVAPAVESSGVWSGEIEMIDEHGRHRPVSLVVVAHRGPDGNIDVISAIGRDVSERKAFEATLEHQATHDPLTALPNRTLLLDRLQVAIGRAERRETSLAVLFLDLDHFKVVNDSLGHGTGDRLLVSLAAQLASLIRPGDTVARFGGDEFVILCEDLSDRQEAHLIAERIATAIAEPVLIGEVEIVVTASIGIAFAHGGSVAAEDLIRDADAAMYQAKSRGRARAEVFDSRMRARAIDRLELETALRRAIDRRELRVFYQPFIDINTGRIVGAEALVRWAHPERGLLLPRDFLAVAEESRLIVPIGNWVVKQACLMEQRVRAIVPDHNPLMFCVNLSGRQLAHPQLVEDISRVLEETSCDPRHLNLEITEHVLMDDVAITASTLRRLKEIGVQLAVDDFGTGYSSLAYLKRFPVDVLKVDQTFVAGLGQNAEDTAIVTAVVNLAHTLGLKAIAEGVETAGQLEELDRLGCDMAQGFYAGRPMPDADLLELL